MKGLHAILSSFADAPQAEPEEDALREAIKRLVGADRHSAGGQQRAAQANPGGGPAPPSIATKCGLSPPSMEFVTGEALTLHQVTGRARPG